MLHRFQKNTKVLSELGLNFQIAPKVFPVVETISATEVFHQEIEKSEGDQFFFKEKASRRRQTVLTHIQKYHDKPIKSNISKKEQKSINYIKKYQKQKNLLLEKLTKEMVLPPMMRLTTFQKNKTS